jgi:hypothetical protein
MTQSLTPNADRAFACARLVEFCDGPERGQRGLLLSSGGGLDLSVMPDRSFDIGELRVAGRQLAWIGPQGLPAPGPMAHAGAQGQSFARSFGGFLVTCGLTHFGPETPSEPQHGRFPFQPSRLLGYGTDFDREIPVVFAEAETVQARYGGEMLSLRRRFELAVGKRTLALSDTITNLGDRDRGLHLMYHFNLGGHAVKPGARVLLDDKLVHGPLDVPVSTPNLAAASFACQSPQRARCRLTTGLEQIDFAWDARQLPFLQIWNDLTQANRVLSIEPRTARPGEDGPVLGPGGAMTVTMQLAFHELNT